MEKTRTVHDFKEFVERESGGHFPPLNRSDARTDRQIDFWERLNRLGARNIETQPPEAVPDIDATVELSDREWDDLTAEFRRVMVT